MSKASKESYEKKLADAILKTDTYFKVCLKTTTSIEDWITATKSYDTLMRRCDFLTSVISNYAFIVRDKDEFHKSALSIKEFALPLLWTEEAKKKPAIKLFYYFSFEWEDNITWTNMIEVNPSKNAVNVENIKLEGVYLDSILRIRAFCCVLTNSNCKITNPATIGINSRTHLDDIDLPKFMPLGVADILMSEFSTDSTPLRAFEFMELKEKKSSEGECVKMFSKNATSAVHKTDTSSDFFETCLHSYSIAGAHFIIEPTIYDKPIKITGKYKWGNKIAIYMVFERQFANFYETSSINFSNPVQSINVLDLTVNKADDSTEKVFLVDSMRGVTIEANFDDEFKADDVNKLLSEYIQLLKLWGNRVNSLPGTFSTYETLENIKMDKSKIIPLLCKLSSRKS